MFIGNSYGQNRALAFPRDYFFKNSRTASKQGSNLIIYKVYIVPPGCGTAAGQGGTAGQA